MKTQYISIEALKHDIFDCYTNTKSTPTHHAEMRSYSTATTTKSIKSHTGIKLSSIPDT